MEKKEILEGGAKLAVPRTQDIHHCLVFYNPEMEFNRSISSLAIGPAAELLGKKIAVIDGLCATGARGVRYAVENPQAVEKVFFVEANDHAIPFIKENVKKNKLGRKSKIVHEDLNLALPKLAFSKQEIDFVEIDPFGSPVPFLENAIRCLDRRGVLSVTATDLANLYGTRPRPCIRQYDSKPLHNFFAHETALRILIGRIARTAAAQDFSATPLLSWYEQHYAKTIVLLEKGADKSDEVLKKSLGFVNFCRRCFFVSSSKTPEKACPSCGNPLEYAGPLWLGDYCDSAFLEKMRKRLDEWGGDWLETKEKERLEKFLSLLGGELEMPPWFFDVHELCSKHGKSGGKIDDLVARLNSSGKKTARTHFSPTGIKTTATAEEIAEKI